MKVGIKMSPTQYEERKKEFDKEQKEKTNEQIIRNIAKFQENPNFHSLTCGNNSKHRDLIGYIMEDGKIGLKCLDCDYIQNHIPPVI